MVRDKRTADPAAIDWRLRTTKRANDSLMSDIIYPVFFKPGKEVRIMSLPAADWLWEKHLLHTFADSTPLKFVFDGVEQDPVVAARSKQTLQKLQRMYGARCAWNLYGSCSVQDLLSIDDNKAKPYDVVYLDWMGTWSQQKQHELSLLAERELLADGGFLLVTLALTRGRVSKELLYELADGEHDVVLLDARPKRENVTGGTHHKTKGIVNWITAIFENNDQALKPVLGKIYYNLRVNASPAPEVLLIFRRDA